MNLSPEEKERFDNLSTSDQLKLEKIFSMMKDEKDKANEIFTTDGGSEDSVDNIDKVASPNAKGKGYDSSMSAQSKESGDEMSQITQTTKPMYEARVDRDVAERIEGMLSIPLKRKFLDSFMDVWQDLIEEDPFYAEDVINHLNNEMHKEIDGYQAVGDKLAGMEENHAMQGVEAELESGEIGNMNALTEISTRDIITALKKANAQDYEIEAYMKSLQKAGDKFDAVDDYVEDFMNYVDDKSLYEHFGRFMKDYQ
jgi:hypothetical protein